MHRLFVLLLLPSIFVLACSGEGKCPSGSECKLVDCSCNEVRCDLYETQNSIKVYYLEVDGNVISRYTAEISIQTSDISSIQGHDFTGDEILADVTLTNTDDNWIAFTPESHCKIDQYGGANGKLEGDCTFIFHHAGTGDFNAHMTFNCTLELPPT